MAADKIQFEFGLKKYNELQKNRHLSVPAHAGALAIFCANPRDDFGPESAKKNMRSNTKTYRKEAAALAKRAELDEKHAEIIYNPGHCDFRAILQDPTFSDIVTVGDGSLSSFDIHNEIDPEQFDWLDAITAASHLKQGTFVQRHCGHFSRSLNVPLGSFVTADPANVHAPVGLYYNGRGLYHHESGNIVPVFTGIELAYRSIKNAFFLLHLFPDKSV